MRIRQLLTKYFLLIIIFSSVLQLKSQNRISSILPIEKAYVFVNTVVFKWNPHSKKSINNTYRLSLATDSAFSSNLQVKNTSNNSDTISLTNAAKYYWKVELIINNLPIASTDIKEFTYSNIYNWPSLQVLLLTDTAIVLDTNNKISLWRNLVDTSKNAIQNTAGFRPSISSPISELNNKSLINFDGIDDYLEILTAVNPAETYTIANWTGSTSIFPNFNGILTGKTAGVVFSANKSSSNFVPSQVFPNAVYFNQKLSLNFAPLSQFKLISGKRNSAYPLSTGMLIASDRLNAGRFWQGNIGDIISFNAPISDSLRKIVNQYLCQKYSKAFSLGEDISLSYGFCDTLIQVDSTYSKYQWSNGDTTFKSMLRPSNEYQLTVTDKFGCTFTDKIAVLSPLKNELDQLKCLTDTFVWDTKLPKSAYTFVWNNSTTDSLLNITQAGGYYVNIADTNFCSITSDTIHVQVDSTLYHVTLGADTSLCLGNQIGLIQPPSTISSYLWSTNQTTDKIAPQSSGLYWLEFTANGCTARDSIQVSIKGSAPTADFMFNNECFGDSVHFIDNSLQPTLGNIVKWRYHFGNNQMDTIPNPTVLYDTAQTFTVSLFVETDSMCTDSISKQLNIYPKPKAGFTQNLACKNDTVIFNDTSSIVSGTINFWRWNFNKVGLPGDTSILQHPITTFPNSKLYPIDLIVYSDKGCSDTVTKNIFVNDKPVPNYSVIGDCLSDSTHFTNLTTVPSGNTLQASYWTFGNTQTSNKMNPTVYFATPKVYFINLKTTASNGCSAEIVRQFEMNDRPIANFVADNFCVNDFSKVTDLSSVKRTTLSNWEYRVNQNNNYRDTAFTQNPSLKIPETGNFTIEQIVTSAKGCKDTIIKSFVAHPKPKAFFNLSSYFGAAPFEIKYDTVTQANNYKWSFGNGDSAFVYQPNYTYTDTGTYYISLLVNNQFGCLDSMKRKIDVRTPNLDLYLDTVIVDQINGNVKIAVVLINTGNNEINSVLMRANLNGFYKLEELWQGVLLPNSFKYVEFSSKVVIENNNFNDFVCIEVKEVNGMKDLDLKRAKVCVEGTAARFYTKAFPSPTYSNINLDMVLPVGDNVKISIYDNLGKIQLNSYDQFFDKGYHSIPINTSVLQNGNYFLIINYLDKNHSISIIKR